MPIILFSNLKGGVAKTTNAVALAECLADRGYRTLLIDADHQCMAGELVLGEQRMFACESRRITLHDLLGSMLEEEFAAEQFNNYVLPNASNIGGGLENLSVVPCSIRIDDFSTNMAKAKRGFHSTEEWQRILAKRRRMFKRWLTTHFHYTIIDCPPSIPLQVRFLLNCADTFIVPSVPDRLSVRGSLYLLERLRRMNMRIEALGTLWTLYREQNRVHREMLNLAQKRDSRLTSLPSPFNTIIPNSTAITSATDSDAQFPSFNAKYSGAFAKRYRDFAAEVVQRCRKRGLVPDREAQQADSQAVP